MLQLGLHDVRIGGRVARGTAFGRCVSLVPSGTRTKTELSVSSIQFRVSASTILAVISPALPSIPSEQKYSVAAESRSPTYAAPRLRPAACILYGRCSTGPPTTSNRQAPLGQVVKTDFASNCTYALCVAPAQDSGFARKILDSHWRFAQFGTGGYALNEH